LGDFGIGWTVGWTVGWTIFVLFYL